MSKAYDVLMVEVGNMSKRQTTAVFDYVDQLRAELASEREAGLRCFEDKVKLEADRDQISLTLAVAKADRDKWFNRAMVLDAALRFCQFYMTDVKFPTDHPMALAISKALTTPETK